MGPVSWNWQTQKSSVNVAEPLSYKFHSNKNLTKAKLIEIAKKAGLKKCSQLNKATLLEFFNSQRCNLAIFGSEITSASTEENLETFRGISDYIAI